MDRERYTAIRNRAFELAKNYGMLDCAEDFAQEAAVTISKGRKATMQQLWIDYLRKEFGSHRDNVSEETKQESKMRLEERKHFDEVDESFLQLSAPEMNSETKRIQNLLVGEDRIIFTFMFYGFTLNEIADAFGVTEGRICQRFAEIKKKIHKRRKDSG